MQSLIQPMKCFTEGTGLTAEFTKRQVPLFGVNVTSLGIVKRVLW